jgi:Sec-independent protein translocase protein TatA
MATCRRCGQSTFLLRKDIFTGLCPRCRGRGRVPPVTPVRLGCGTLIIVAIIVAIFSQVGNEDLESEISSLQLLVQELKQAVDSQTNEIQELHSKIDKLNELQQEHVKKADE